KPLSDPYPKGLTTITWTATSSGGRSAGYPQTVTVNDTENPVITCPTPIVQSTDAGKCYATVAITPATATDNCPGQSVAGVRSDIGRASCRDRVELATITWSATDASGNTASCRQTVTVNDTDNTVIT